MAAPGEKSFFVLEYHAAHCGYCATCISCTVRNKPPTDNSIPVWHKQFAETGWKSSGRPLTAEDDVERVRASFAAKSEEINGNCN